MKKSKVIYNFTISQQQGKILLTAQEYPWSVLQVITFEPEYFDKVVEIRTENILISISILIRQQLSTSIWRH